MGNKKWNLVDYVYNAKVSVEDLTDAIRVFEILKEKYPNDENITFAIDILRDEVCQMFGGSIFSECCDE